MKLNHQKAHRYDSNVPLYLRLFNTGIHMNKLIVPILFLTLLFQSADLSARRGIPNFKWMKDVGAKSFPKAGKTFYVNDFGGTGDAIFDNTSAIQKTIDACAAAGGGTVSFHPGIYLTGSVFIKSNVIFNVPKGVMIAGSQNIEDYKKINTRVAGIEMKWPAALINIIGQTNAAITGDGVIHGRGKVFWDKYWTMRRDYEPRGLRWIVDYDCERPRGILIAECRDVTVKDIVLYQPGFWSLHILYSEHVTVDNIIISNNIEGRGPSTDGVDIDSSRKILVQNSYINCNDDNFCLKAGRDADGLRVNRPTEYIVIRNCVAGHGDGLFTLGSETSGGIRNVVAYNLKAHGTSYGIRFKSTTQRGGVIENIYLSNIVMYDVRNPFTVDLNWHPSYSTSLLPEGYDYESLPIHWKVMLQEVSPEQGTPKFRNIFLENVKATGARTAIRTIGIESSTLDNFHLSNVSIEAQSAGTINWARDWNIRNLVIKSADGNPVRINNSENVRL